MSPPWASHPFSDLALLLFNEEAGFDHQQQIFCETEAAFPRS